MIFLPNQRIGSWYLCLALLFSFSLGISSCVKAPEPATEEPAEAPISSTELTINTRDYVASEGNISQTDDGIVTSADSTGWLAYDIVVPTAGRYQVNIKASGSDPAAAVWVEDYIDNKDGRTYNITGSMALAGQAGTVSVDGSPMNKGPHKIKLHLHGPGTAVESLTFTLLKEHQLTPQVLTQNMEGEEWEVVWSDEFEGTGLPDTSKWTFDIGDWGWGNNELQYYTELRPENARLEDGNLIIEARKDDMGHPWTSARLTTRGKTTFTYGRIEFKAKVPPTRGNWAAGWTLGDNYVDEISWPYCGEIDIMESVGFEMDDVTFDGEAHASVHCGAYYFKLGNHHTGTIEVKNMHEEFHTYAVDWTPEGITAYVDDQAYFSYNDTSNDLAWPFNKPQNIILNLAMGGGWGGAQGMDENMTSQQIVIDYVRVYGKK